MVNQEELRDDQGLGETSEQAEESRRLREMAEDLEKRSGSGNPEVWEKKTDKEGEYYELKEKKGPSREEEIAYLKKRKKDQEEQENWYDEEFETIKYRSDQLVKEANKANSIDELCDILSRGEVILMGGMISPATDMTRQEDKITPWGLAAQIRSMKEDLDRGEYSIDTQKNFGTRFLKAYGLDRAIELLGLPRL
ncbi:MAG: hypothetical protein A3D44_01625 [Candidatus Staskawiczbacteria bacterium RIFCSPHIGHO2_02_FULL_42_22]|uniref:Uncharacterized protein n=1 Tax=Candidatus Staskawiczbacteria bacterium RIFCSPHIGHO2_02_FULL_42_22 TaxID=1802207 RepID=A0A1G2HZV3_9BACT|nr:MAG: hypothetical protein A3D44_01625 [Candidatus Staskawiczbacteria bacterium RIFCSPHIGHO2_02_FULL_42_22]